MIVQSTFRPVRWLRNRHLQTLWPVLIRRAPRIEYRRERLALPDGDWLELAWGPARPGPVVVLLHGLAGCAESGYIRRLVHALARQGLAAAVMQFRGASRVPNRLDRFFHAGEIDDLDVVVDHVARRFPNRPRAAVGFSLGASMLLNWLGARGAGAKLQAACAVSVPFDLAACADALDRGFCRLYQRDLVRTLRCMTRSKFHHRPDAPVDLARLAALRTLRQFDDDVTAPLHGFAGADDYYSRASCRDRLGTICRPTLILQAADDPFVPLASLPRPSQLSPQVRLELADRGGHVGFIAGPGQNWLERRILSFLAAALAVGDTAKCLAAGGTSPS